MKRLLSYILILLFSFQVLPVKELGKLMIKKAATEQVEDGDEDAGSSKQKSEEGAKLFPNSSALRLRQLIADRQAQTALHRSCILPPRFVPDITTPPPDRC